VPHSFQVIFLFTVWRCDVFIFGQIFAGSFLYQPSVCVVVVSLTKARWRQRRSTSWHAVPGLWLI